MNNKKNSKVCAHRLHILWFLRFLSLSSISSSSKVFSSIQSWIFVVISISESSSAWYLSLRFLCVSWVKKSNPIHSNCSSRNLFRFSALIGGKYSSLLIYSSVFILSSLILYFSLTLLGNFPGGIIISQIFGSILLIGAMFSVSFLASALPKIKCSHFFSESHWFPPHHIVGVSLSSLQLPSPRQISLSILVSLSRR